MVKKLVIILLSIVGWRASYGQKAYDRMLRNMYKETVPLIQPSTLDSLIAHQNPIILDTREPKEFHVSHVSSSICVGYDNLDLSVLDTLDKNQEIIVYCSVGYRSERVGEKLQNRGFNNVKNLYGGIFRWKNDGYGVVNWEGDTTDRVHAYDRLWGVWLKKGKKVY